MNNLTIINQDGKLLADSLQVAEMICKPHNDLMKSIRQYSEYLGQGNFSLTDFFIESTYVSDQNKTLPCYLITKKGCDMVANKMTGEKGVLFTATYVIRFDEMEKQLTAPVPMTQLEMIAYSAQALLAQEKQIQQISAAQTKQAEELQGMRDVITLSTISWREDTKNLLVKIAQKAGDVQVISDLWKEAYKYLDSRMGVKLKTRLDNLRKNMADEGVCKSKRDKANVLDVIGKDKKLIEGFVAIVKEMAIKAGVSQ